MAARQVGRTEEQRVQDVLKQHQKNISPKGVAAAEAAAKKALEKKYPGLVSTTPTVRRTSGINRGN